MVEVHLERMVVLSKSLRACIAYASSKTKPGGRRTNVNPSEPGHPV